MREDLIDMPLPPALDQLPLSTAVPSPLPPLNGYTFEGYRNSDGSVGTRNILGIATTVQCVAPTVEYAARRIKAELLPRFPNVDDVVAVTHSYGCGVAINAPGAAIPIATLRHISLHANMAAQPLVVSLGCEKMQPALLFSNDFPVLEPSVLDSANVIRLQDHRGFSEMVALILEGCRRNVWRCLIAAGGKRVPLPISSSACNAEAATLFPASRAIPRWARPPISSFAPAQPSCFPKSPKCAMQFICSLPAPRLPTWPARSFAKCSGTTTISPVDAQIAARTRRRATSAEVSPISSKKPWAA